MVFQLRKYCDSSSFFFFFFIYLYVGYHWYGLCTCPPKWDRVTSPPVTRQERITTNIHFDLGRTIVPILGPLIKSFVGSNLGLLQHPEDFQLDSILFFI